MAEDSPPQTTTVLIACLDSIKQKNLYQLQGLDARRYRFEIVTTDSMGDSRQIVGQSDNIRVHVCNPRHVRSSMLWLVVKVLLSRRVHVAEIYPNSLLALVTLLIVKLCGVPVILIARGEEYYYVTDQMSPRRRRGFEATYRLADYVIYKELYMKDMLARMGKHDVWMLSNAVPIPELANRQEPGKCHLLYLNSIKDFRYPEIPLQAFLELCDELKLDSRSNIRLYIVGFLEEQAPDEIARKEAALRAMVDGMDVPVEMHPWALQPAKWLDDADLFLLPADVVYLNYSLLEAMARGVTPIVQDTDGADLILRRDEEGYILARDVVAWKDAMRHLILDPALRARLGSAARARVADCFSLDAYLHQYDMIYQHILGRKRAGPCDSARARQEVQ